MATQIQLRRDTAADWTSDNPVLAQGEIGIQLPASEGTQPSLKVGDGVTVWSELPFYTSDVFGVVPSMSNTAIQAAINAAQTVNGVVSFASGNYPSITQLEVTAAVTLQFSGEAVTTLTAASGATGPLLYFNPGSQIVVTVKGGVTINMAAAATGCVAVSMNNLANVEQFEDITVVNTQYAGFQLSNCNNLHMERLSDTGGTYGILCNGDTCGELTFDNCDITNNSSTMTAAFASLRTTASDTGGWYINQMKITRGGGTTTNGILFSNSVGSGTDTSPLFINHSIIDNTNGQSALVVQNKKYVTLNNVWHTLPSGNTYPVIALSNCTQIYIGGGCTIEGGNNGFGIGVDFQNGCQAIVIDGANFSGTFVALGFNVGSAPSNVVLGSFVNNCPNLTNNFTAMAENAGNNASLGMQVYTSGSSGSLQSLGLINGVNTAYAKWIRINGSNQMEILNVAFSGAVLQLTDGGLLAVAGGVNFGNFGSIDSGGDGLCWNGSGVPSNANGSNGDYYFRKDASGANTHIYFKASGTWTGIV